jgi:hypothetical protein
MAKRFAKIKKSTNHSTSRKNLLDKDPKRPRGRPATVESSLILKRANYLHDNLGRVWDTLGSALLAARSTTDVAKAFDNAYIGQAVSPELFPLVLAVVRDRDFPKTAKAQTRFLAESLSGWGVMSPRRARDVCAAERKKPQPTRIIRIEFYIECSCGYSGPSRDWGCPKCHAVIPPEFRPRLNW